MSCLGFEIVAECATSKARTALMRLPHATVETPVFMPVGTQGTLKGLLVEQAEALGCRIMLGNTYHLGHRPGGELVARAGGLHAFMKWGGALLTDSGGFQMVSLCKLMQVTEEGVRFVSPHTSEESLLTPEASIAIQNSLGADIIMQLDDVVHVLTEGARVEQAMERSVRWLDRCLAAHGRPAEQALFPVVQGGLDPALRRRCVHLMRQRAVDGFAIGGLSGGEAKEQFCATVSLCTDLLPRDRPRYVMGVGYAVDLVVCCALGADMFDCVFPTRTARFGVALVPDGELKLANKQFRRDARAIQADCPCETCRRHSRAFLHCVVTHETVACHLISLHNVCYQLTLMKQLRQSIRDGRFPEFVRSFMLRRFPTVDSAPEWVVQALRTVNINIYD